MSSNPNQYRLIGDAYRHADTQRTRSPRRIFLFLSVFLPLLLATQIYVFLQPAIYVSEASVLTTAATAVDQASPEADLQHVSIQKELLLGQAILEKTAQQLAPHEDSSSHWSADELRSMFAVAPIADTNLLKLSAEGTDPTLLKRALNAWLEAYRQARAEYVEEISEKVTDTLNHELTLIERQVNDKRREMNEFRLQHDIVSDESTDNQAHARQHGLNESLNKALEEEVKAKAKMDAIHSAIAQGKAVVPEDDSRSLAVMMDRAGKLRDKIAALRGQYTDEYIRFNPALRNIPEELAELEEKIKTKLDAGGRVVAQEADNEYAAARQSVTTIQRQMSEHKQQAAEYTSQFAKHQALKEELLKLETLQQETKQRLVDIEVKQRQKYPQVEVIDSATLPGKPIRPNYWQESAIAFAACLGLGLLAVWIADYLRREETIPAWEAVPSVQLRAAPRPAFARFAAARPITVNATRALESDTPIRELSQEETASLFEAADRQTRQILALLLNGLTAAEILSLTADSFDLAQQKVYIPLSGRSLPMTEQTAALLTGPGWQPIPLTVHELDAMLTCAAIDAGLSGAEQVDTECLSYTYTLFLIRQGIKLTDLTKIIGPVNPSRLLQLGKYSPEGAGLPLEQIDRDYLKDHWSDDSRPEP
ncbi:MAG: GumC family protein [Methylomonas sp.]